jgi:serine/threonine protein phosphatase 1
MPAAPLDYPLVAVGDLHGQREWLAALVDRLRALPEWPAARLVFLGDLVDRGPDVPGTVQLVLDLLAEKPGSVCVMGNHDLALVRAAGLDGEPSEWWRKRYGDNYDHVPTFTGYLGKEPQYLSADDWANDLALLREAMPPAHREFLASLPWVAEAAGHVFIHNGLSPDLDEPAETQLELLRRKRWAVRRELLRREKWDSYVTPKLGTDTHRLFNPEYPVWLGADKSLSDRPLPVPGRVIVSGHRHVPAPDANAVRIRIDTSGGQHPPLTACVLRGPAAEPTFVTSQ